MFNSIIAVVLICLGVANATPFEHNTNEVEQKQNYIEQPKKAEYTQLINLNNTSKLTYDLGQGQNTQRVKYQTQSNLSFNLIGTADFFYNTNYPIVYENDEYNREDYNPYYNIGMYLDRQSAITHRIQIDPYNLTKDTKFKVQFRLKNPNDMIVRSSRITFYGVIYKSTEQNWINYINQQPTQSMIRATLNDIENINNGYRYIKTQITPREIQTNNYANPFLELGVNLDVTAETTNYYFIYIFCLTLANGGGDMTLPDAQVFQPSASGGIGVIESTAVVPTGNIEVIDLPGLMFEILSMPFTFISTAFNLTLFPNTPYQLNIANLFLAILAVILFGWIISTLIKR